MTHDRHDSHPWLTWSSGMLSAMTFAIAMAAFAGWIFTIPVLATFGEGLIPMAPSTALVFLMLGAAGVLSSIFRDSQRTRSAARWLILPCIPLTALLLVLSSFGTFLPIERLGVAPSATLGSYPVGHMSPITAVAFLALSILGLIHLSNVPPSATIRHGAFAAAMLLAAGFLSVVLAYGLGSPLLYGGSIIPPSLPTAMAFVALSGASIVHVRLDSWRASTISGTPMARTAWILIGLYVMIGSAILGVGYANFQAFESEMRQEVEHRLAAVGDLKVREIHQWRTERFGDARVFHRNSEFSRAVREYLDEPSASVPRKRLRTWLQQVRDAYDYDEVCIIDRTFGIHLAATDDEPAHGPGEEAEARRALRTEEIRIRDLDREPGAEDPSLSLIVPIQASDPARPPIALLIFNVNPRTYLFPMLADWPTPSRTAETLLLRADGDSIVFLNELRFSPKASLRLRLSLSDTLIPAVKAARGAHGVVEGIDYRGHAVLAHVQPVPDSPWFLVARIDQEEVFAPIRERLWLTVMMTVLLLFSGGFGITAVWKNLRSRFYRERYQAERERAWLLDVIARSLDEIFVFDTTTYRFKFVNDGALRNLGYSQEEISLLTPLDLKPDHSAESFSELVAPLMNGEAETVRFETRHRRKDGSLYPVDVHLQVIDQPEGSVFLAIITDITERKHAEEQIRRLNRVYAVLSDINQTIVRERDLDRLFERCCAIAVEKGNLPLAWIGLLQPDGRSLRIAASAGASGDYRDHLGTTVNGNLPADCPILAAVHDRPSLPCHVATGDVCRWSASAIQLRSVVVFPLRVRGAVRGCLALYASEDDFFDEGELRLLEELSMDISFAMEFAEGERMREETVEQLRSSEERYRTLYHNAPVGYHEIDAEGRITGVNQTELTMLGFASEEMVGRPVWEFSTDPNSSRDRVREKLAGTLPPDQNKERTIRRKNGTYLDVQVDENPLFDSKGQIVGMRTVLQDISYRKHAEEMRRSLESRLQQAQKLESLGTLASGIAHDFNNILGVIVGQTGLLTMPNLDPESVRSRAETIESTAMRGAEVVRQMLTFARKSDVSFGPVDLNAIIDEIRQFIRETFPRSIDLQVHLSEPLLPMRADVSQIHQVVLNLCVNARDAMPNGGSLTISTAIVPAESAAKEVPHAQPSPYLLLTVADTGTGMDDEVQRRVYEPFFTTKPIGKGTGLGLSVVFGIVESHNGHISFDSSPGVGTTFRCYFPAWERSPEADTERPASAPVSHRGTETILLVEDEEDLAMAAQLMLEAEGYTVLAARNGEEALSIFEDRRKEIHLVVSDLGLPRFGGDEVVRRMKAIDPSVRFILASGFISPDTKSALSALGARDFVQKPYTRMNLLRAVRTALDV